MASLASLAFQKYPSIENPREKIISDLEKYGYTESDNQWCATEKIHGSNFSFITDGENILCARRSSILNDEQFYNYQDVLSKYRNDILRLFDEIKIEFPEITQIQIYGELFGGYFPEFVSSKPRIQKGVHYTPDIDFMVFDISVTSGEETVLLSQDDIDLYFSCDTMMLKSVPVIACGTYEELAAMSPIFATKIPDMLGLPPIENNFAEGFVMKLNKRHTVGHTRPILKCKNFKFAEVNKKSTKSFVDDPSYQHVLPYCTQERFNNTVSKFGPDVNLHMLTNFFVNDAVDDYKKDLTEKDLIEFAKSEKKIKKKIIHHLHKNNCINAWYN